MNKLFASALLAFILAACSNSGQRKNATTLTPAFPAPTTPVTPTTGQQQPPVTAPAITPVQTNPGTSAVALNPAHGQPGHRCDIPEGAPLNSAPASAPANAVAPPPAFNTSPVISQPQPTNSNVKLNPAHGLPGHDCSVPVGQPLKS